MASSTSNGVDGSCQPARVTEDASTVLGGTDRGGVPFDPQTPGPKPTKKRKGVRFSDPGPSRDRENTQPDASTGLTPHVSRTRISSEGEDPSPRKKKVRRHTAPPPSYEVEHINLESLPSPGSRVLYQWLPMDDRIDPRSIRRIKRSGLSEGMNSLQEEKRSRKRKEREWEKELTALKRRLSYFENAESTAEDVRSGQADDVNPTNVGLFDGVTPQTPVAGGARSGSAIPPPENLETPDSDGISIITDDETRGNSTLDTPLTTFPTTPTDEGPLSNPQREEELEKLNKDLEQELERRKLEQRRFFEALQQEAHVQKVADTLCDSNEGSGLPPPNLENQVIATLKVVGTRASDAVESLEGIYHELHEHGFDGTDVPEILKSIGEHFRHARMELERGLPGETTQGDFSDWKGILEAFIERVNCLIRDLGNAREEITGCENRESALRRQFDASLLRLEDAMKKNESLEKYSETVAEDMLHARMRIQNLEKEKEAQESDKSRLQDALEKYREDVKMLESLNTQLEERMDTLKRVRHESRNTIGNLRADLHQEQEAHRMAQASLDQRNADISSLQNKIRELEAEKQDVVASLENAATERSRRHEQEVGLLNARLSRLVTSLDEAMHEKQDLLEAKERLENRLNSLEVLFSRDFGEVHARLNQAAHDFAKWQANENQQAGECDGDTEPDDSDLNDPGEVENRHSFSNVGGEPITPAPESRFKNVEFARGKKRRRPPVDTLYEEEESVD